MQRPEGRFANLQALLQYRDWSTVSSAPQWCGCVPEASGADGSACACSADVDAQLSDLIRRLASIRSAPPRRNSEPSVALCREASRTLVQSCRAHRLLTEHFRTNPFKAFEPDEAPGQSARQSQNRDEPPTDPDGLNLSSSPPSDTPVMGQFLDSAVVEALVASPEELASPVTGPLRSLIRDWRARSPLRPLGGR
jgi:hypothetical protein